MIALMKCNQCAFNTPGLCPDHAHTSDALVCVLVDRGEKLLMSSGIPILKSLKEEIEMSL
jgi:hypothetical protein